MAQTAQQLTWLVYNVEMARTTINDCIKKCPNHFELVIGAAERAKMLINGHASELATDHDKQIVLALREIAAGTYNIDLEESIKRSLGEHNEVQGNFCSPDKAGELDGYHNNSGRTSQPVRR